MFQKQLMPIALNAEVGFVNSVTPRRRCAVLPVDTKHLARCSDRGVSKSGSSAPALTATHCFLAIRRHRCSVVLDVPPDLGRKRRSRDALRSESVSVTAAAWSSTTLNRTAKGSSALVNALWPIRASGRQQFQCPLIAARQSL
jgi:hypothetical protein